MPSRTIAPALRELFADPPDDLRIPEYAPARAELRALLAVARAAQRVAADTIGDEDAIVHLCTLDRALAHLYRRPSPKARTR